MGGAMTAETLTLADWLRARYDEEAAAWSDGTYLATRPDFAQMSRHMLADIEAKRRIVELHQPIEEAYPARSYPGGVRPLCCDNCSAGGEYPGGWPCETMAALASVYADHPDYREEWRP